MEDLKSKYQSNSYKSKEEKKRTVQKVTKGGVTRKKTPLGRRIVRTFIVADLKDVAMDVLYDELIPSVKDMIQDSVVSGIEAMFGQHTRRSKKPKNEKGSIYVGYDGYYKGSENVRKHRDQTVYDFADIEFEFYEDAAGVLDQLKDIILQDGVVEVADLYAMVDEVPDIRDNQYGWDNLRNARVRRSKDSGYYLDLPRPVRLD